MISKKTLSDLESRSHPVVLACFLALSFFLRVWGIDFGLPDLYHADEPIVVNHAVAYGSGDFNPHFFKIPPLVSYSLFVCFGIYFGIGRVVGWFHSVPDFEYLFLTDPTSFYLIGRILFGALLGTVNIYLLYRVVKRFFSKETALLSAFFLAANFLHVRDSHYIYTDIPLLVVLTACFFPILNILKRSETRDYLTIGFLTGLAAAVKYNGVLIVIPYLLAHFLRNGMAWRSVADKRLWASGLIAILTYSILNPFSILDYRFFLNELFKQSHSEGFIGFPHHIQYSLWYGMSPILLVMSFIGVLRSFFIKSREACVISWFVVGYYLLLVIRSQPYDRYVLPLIPFLMVLAADSIIAFRNRFRLDVVVIGLIVLCALPPLAMSCLSNNLFSVKDIRTVAREWVEANIPFGYKIALYTHFFTPRLKPTVAQLKAKKEKVAMRSSFSKSQRRRLDVMIRDAEKSREPHYELYFMGDDPKDGEFLFAEPRVPYDIDGLIQMNIDYVVVNMESPTVQDPYVRELREKGIKLKVFDPYRVKSHKWPWPIDQYAMTGGPFLWKELVGRERNGQVIEIYKLAKD